MSFKVLVIDNYDSFVYNLVQYLGELNAEPIVKRHDAITIDVTCASGTYIRSLAKDICSSLGEYGYLESLVRTEIGDINRKKCYKIDEIENWKSLIQ